MEPSLASYLALSGILFTIGCVGVIFKRNAIGMFMCIELMLNAVNLSFVALAQYHGLAGQVMVFFVMTVAAAEAAVGLAINGCGGVFGAVGGATGPLSCAPLPLPPHPAMKTHASETHARRLQRPMTIL